jgi:hypothetical protein
MAKIKPFGLIMEIIAVLAGVAMIIVSYLVFTPGINLPFMLLAIAGGVFILAGLIFLIIDIWKLGKKDESIV